MSRSSKVRRIFIRSRDSKLMEPSLGVTSAWSGNKLKSSGPKGKGLKESKVLYRLQETNTDITDIIDSKVRSINARIRDYKVKRINNQE